MDFHKFYNKHIIIIIIFIKMYGKKFFLNGQINYTYIMVFRDLCKQLN